MKKSRYLIAFFVLLIIILLVIYKNFLYSPLENEEDVEVGCLSFQEEPPDKNCVANSLALNNYQRFGAELNINLKEITNLILDCFKSKGILSPEGGVSLTNLPEAYECKLLVMDVRYGKKEEEKTTHASAGSSPFVGNCPPLNTPFIMVIVKNGAAHSATCVATFCNPHNGDTVVVCTEHPAQGGATWTAAVSSNGHITTMNPPGQLSNGESAIGALVTSVTILS